MSSNPDLEETLIKTSEGREQLICQWFRSNFKVRDADNRRTRSRQQWDLEIISAKAYSWLTTCFDRTVKEWRCTACFHAQSPFDIATEFPRRLSNEVSPHLSHAPLSLKRDFDSTSSLHSIRNRHTTFMFFPSTIPSAKRIFFKNGLELHDPPDSSVQAAFSQKMTH